MKHTGTQCVLTWFDAQTLLHDSVSEIYIDLFCGYMTAAGLNFEQVIFLFILHFRLN